MNSIDQYLTTRLTERSRQGLYRNLSAENNLIDFASNDYLGFACSNDLKGVVKNSEIRVGRFNGSTGSRLITGNYNFGVELEEFIANYHKADAALIFNSGYDANLGLFSSLPQKGDTVIYDEYIHASIRDGIRLSFASAYSFNHNDVEALKNKLKKARGRVFVAVESVYSMDGDFAPLTEICKLCKENNAALIVDEAHATGIFGENGAGLVLELGLQKEVFARIHTFGKALGCHGAAVLGSESLKNYLVNFSRPFIFTTGLPLATLETIKSAYLNLPAAKENIAKIKDLIQIFKTKINSSGHFKLIESNSPIQCIVIPGIEKVKLCAEKIRASGFDVRAILSPTVPAGKERIRICLHSFNNVQEIMGLIDALNRHHQVMQ